MKKLFGKQSTGKLRRDGQVYYVYNRVNDIADVAARLSELIPDARVDFAHGQMSERELEAVMYSFINGEIDVLVSTTIIETGLDISNVNTMIIHDSDRYGLSRFTASGEERTFQSYCVCVLNVPQKYNA